MEVEITPVKEQDKSILWQLMQLYIHDFSEYIIVDVNEQGFYNYKYFDTYWEEIGRYPYFIKVDEHYAGFVLVNQDFYLLKAESAHVISEFFVMRHYRRKGVGAYAARKVFDQFPGRWEVSQIKKNAESTLFWEKVIGAYTHGKYQMVEAVKKGLDRQVFHF